MSEEEKRKREQRKKQQNIRKQKQQTEFKRKYRSIHDKHRERRKKDCMIGLPFITAFQGDPARLFYCADIPDRYELIPRTNNYPDWEKPLGRLMRYLDHHITQIHNKVLVYKAG
jgi:hypothetical protein